MKSTLRKQIGWHNQTNLVGYVCVVITKYFTYQCHLVYIPTVATTKKNGEDLWLPQQIFLVEATSNMGLGNHVNLICTLVGTTKNNIYIN